MEDICTSNVANAICMLPFQDPPGKYVKAVLKDNFPARCEQKFVNSSAKYKRVLNEARSALRLWIKENLTDKSTQAVQQSSSRLWKEIHSRAIPMEGLQVLLYNFMNEGISPTADVCGNELALNGAEMYFMLAAVPGSELYFFNCSLFQRAMDSFKIATKLRKLTEKSSKKGAQADQSDNEFEDNDSFDDNGAFQRAVQALSNGLVQAVEGLTVFVKYFPPDELGTMESVIAVLLSLTRRETKFASLEFNEKHRQSAFSLAAQHAYVGLEIMCGKNIDYMTKVFFDLLPSIQMTPAKDGVLYLPKALLVIRDHSLYFIYHLVEMKQELTFHPVRVLITHMCFKTPERADARSKNAEAVIEIITRLPQKECTTSVRDILTGAFNEKAAIRLFSVDFIWQLLLRFSENIPGHSKPRSGSLNNSTGKTRIDIYLQRLLFGVLCRLMYDIGSTVRQRALMAIQEILLRPELSQKMFKIPDPEVQEQNFDESAENVGDGATQPVKSIDNFRDLSEILRNYDFDLRTVNPVPSVTDFIKLINCKTKEESVFVRRNAFQIIESVLKNRSFISPECSTFLETLTNHCRDPSIMIRKQMTTALSNLLEANPSDKDILASWVGGPLSLVQDTEITVQEKAREAITHLVFNQITRLGNETAPQNKLPWKILSECQKQNRMIYLSKACEYWARHKDFSMKMIDNLCSHVEVENPNHNVAWLLLSLMSVSVKLPILPFVLNRFKKHVESVQNGNSDSGLSRHVLRQVLMILKASTDRFTKEDQEDLFNTTRTFIKCFKGKSEQFSIAVDICALIAQNRASSARMKDPESIISLVVQEEWGTEIIQIITDKLTVALRSSGKEETDEIELQVLTLGNIAQFCHRKIDKRHSLLLESIVFQKTSRRRGAAPLSQDFVPSKRLQAMSISTLSKICIEKEDLAKKIVPAFGSLLEKTKDSVIKRSLVCSLADMCMRHANVVEPYLPQILAKLQDHDKHVKRETLIHLVRLSRNDYLKISRHLLFAILTLSIDPIAEVVEIARFYIQKTLIPKIPKVMGNNFPEALRHYNGFQITGPFASLYDASKKDRNLFIFVGKTPELRLNRLKILKYMLECMTDDQKVSVVGHLWTDILNVVGEKYFIENEKDFEIIRDTLTCLTCDEMKLSCLKNKPEDETEQADNDCPQEDTKRKAQILQMLKETNIHLVIPSLIKLYKKVVSARSQLRALVMIYFRELMKDHKNDLKDILSTDRDTFSEITMECKKWQELQAERLRKDRRSQATEPEREVAPSENISKRRHLSRTSESSADFRADHSEPMETDGACASVSRLKANLEVFERINPEMLGQVMNATREILTKNSRRDRTMSSASVVTNASTSEAMEVDEARCSARSRKEARKRPRNSASASFDGVWQFVPPISDQVPEVFLESVTESSIKRGGRRISSGSSVSIVSEQEARESVKNGNLVASQEQEDSAPITTTNSQEECRLSDNRNDDGQDDADVSLPQPEVVKPTTGSVPPCETVQTGSSEVTTTSPLTVTRVRKRLQKREVSTPLIEEPQQAINQESRASSEDNDVEERNKITSSKPKRSNPRSTAGLRRKPATARRDDSVDREGSVESSRSDRLGTTSTAIPEHSSLTQLDSEEGKSDSDGEQSRPRHQCCRKSTSRYSHTSKKLVSSETPPTTPEASDSMKESRCKKSSQVVRCGVSRCSYRRDSKLTRPRSESLDSDSEGGPSTSKSQLHERKTTKSKRLPSQNSDSEVDELSPSAKKSRQEGRLTDQLIPLAIPLLNVVSQEPVCSPSSQRSNSSGSNFNDRNSNGPVGNSPTFKTPRFGIQKPCKITSSEPQSNHSEEVIQRLPIPAGRRALRAISTPDRNETRLMSNVTFMDNTTEISAITVASYESENTNESESSLATLKFKHRRPDPFDDLIEKASSKKKKK